MSHPEQPDQPQQPAPQQPAPQQPAPQQPAGPPPPQPTTPYQQGYAPQPGQPPYQQGYPPAPQAGLPMPLYGPPGTAQGYPPNSDERTWAMLAHGSYFVLSLIGPLIIMLTKGKESPFVRQAAVEALNFHLSLFIYSLVSLVLMIVLVGFLTLVATIVFGFVVAIMALVATNQGQAYRYPLTIRMVS